MKYILQSAIIAVLPFFISCTTNNTVPDYDETNYEKEGSTFLNCYLQSQLAFDQKCSNNTLQCKQEVNTCKENPDAACQYILQSKHTSTLAEPFPTPQKLKQMILIQLKPKDQAASDQIDDYVDGYNTTYTAWDAADPAVKANANSTETSAVTAKLAGLDVFRAQIAPKCMVQPDFAENSQKCFNLCLEDITDDDAKAFIQNNFNCFDNDKVVTPPTDPVQTNTTLTNTTLTNTTITNTTQLNSNDTEVIPKQKKGGELIETPTSYSGILSYGIMVLILIFLILI